MILQQTTMFWRTRGDCSSARSATMVGANEPRQRLCRGLKTMHRPESTEAFFRAAGQRAGIAANAGNWPQVAQERERVKALLSIQPEEQADLLTMCVINSIIETN